MIDPNRPEGDYGGRACVKFMDFHMTEVKNPTFESVKIDLKNANQRIEELRKESVGEKLISFFQTIFKSLGMIKLAESCEGAVNRLSNDRLFKLGKVKNDKDSFKKYMTNFCSAKQRSAVV